jgi:hypothetical protein
MARKSSVNHAVKALFSIATRDLVDQIAGFCAIKRLGWSPDVKIAMQRMPALIIEEAAWAALNAVSPGVLHDTLTALLAPIKEHQLFDLADWMRDLSGGQVPEYLMTHWSNTRVPKGLDEMMKQALKIAPSIQVPDEDEDDSIHTDAGKQKRKSKPSAKRDGDRQPWRMPKGPAAKGKVSKQGWTPSVAAMQRIAQGQEDIAVFLSKGNVKPAAKQAFYRDVAHRSFTAYGVSDVLAKERMQKGVPLINIDYKAIGGDTLDALRAELKEVFRNKAHVNVEPEQTQIVLRTRKMAGSALPGRAPVAKAPAKKTPTFAPQAIRTRNQKAKAKARKSAKTGSNGNKEVFAFPTSDNNPKRANGNGDGNGQQQPQS